MRTGALAASVAAASTTTIAVVARAAGIDLEVDGVPIPVLAFTWWTLVGAALGIGLACILRTRRRFVGVTVAATAASLIPAAMFPADTSTAAVLVGAHLVAAAIVIPSLARQLGHATTEARH